MTKKKILLSTALGVSLILFYLSVIGKAEAQEPSSTPEMPGCTFDENGVAVTIYKEQYGIEGPQYNPQNTALCALTALSLYKKTRNEGYLDIFLRQVNWFCENQVTYENGAGVWEYPFDWNYKNLEVIKAPWVSGLAQGSVLSVLTQAYLLSGEKKYLEKAEKALKSFEVPVSEGGVASVEPDRTLWYQEYPTKVPSYVLNGHIDALTGLRIFWEATDSQKAEELFQLGLASLKKKLPLFLIRDGADWVSTYDLLRIEPTLNFRFTGRAKEITAERIELIGRAGKVVDSKGRGELKVFEIEDTPDAAGKRDEILLNNFGFEDPSGEDPSLPAYWARFIGRQAYRDCEEAFSGKCSARVEGSGTRWEVIAQTIPAGSYKPATRYIVSFYAKVKGETRGRVTIFTPGNPNKVLSETYTALSEEWRRYRLVLITPESASLPLVLELYQADYKDPDSLIWYDEIKIDKDDNLLLNGDFEEESGDPSLPAYWKRFIGRQAYRDCEEAFYGKCSARVEGSGKGWEVIAQTIPAGSYEPDRRYLVSFHAKVEGKVPGRATLYIPREKNQILREVYFVRSPSWHRYKFAFNTPAQNNVPLIFELYQKEHHVSESTIWYDRVEIMEAESEESSFSLEMPISVNEHPELKVSLTYTSPLSGKVYLEVHDGVEWLKLGELPENPLGKPTRFEVELLPLAQHRHIHLGYHVGHVIQLLKLFDCTEDPLFEEYAKKIFPIAVELHGGQWDVWQSP